MEQLQLSNAVAAGGVGNMVPGSVVDPDPYWICIQELSGSGSVFGIQIRIQIYTCKFRLASARLLGQRSRV